MTAQRGDEFEEVCFPAGRVDLAGFLGVPAGAQGMVVFVHGSGSSRFSTRNQHVARMLMRAGLATFLFDLLTQKEQQIDEVTAELRFDIDLLVERLLATTSWRSEERRVGKESRARWARHR